MIYALALDRSEVGHVMPVVEELRLAGTDVRVVDSVSACADINRGDRVLCVGDRLSTLKWILDHCPTAYIIQLHAGEYTGPYLDDSKYRWAISAIASCHLCATLTAQRNINGLYPCNESVYRVGTPALEHAEERVVEARNRRPLDGRTYVLWAMNSWVGSTQADIDRCLMQTCSAASRRGWWVYAVRPNCESEHEIKERFANSYIQADYAIPHDEFQRIIAGARLMVGNSSAGIIEAPSLGTQTINVGPRQDGRERASSILDVKTADDIGEAFDMAQSLSFRYTPYNEVEHPARVAAMAVQEVARG